MIDFSFLSTHPSRSATETDRIESILSNVSIHAPLAECDDADGTTTNDDVVSIHAPLAECDASGYLSPLHGLVSIHAPLAECDKFIAMLFSFSEGFYPRTPRGVRPSVPASALTSMKFLSTHPSRSATRSVLWCPLLLLVSIHAPLAECDLQAPDVSHI